MTLASSKTSLKMAAFPRGVSFIAASMALLAMFLIFASWLLVSYPITSTVSEYISGVNRKIVLPAKDVSGSSLEQLTMTSNSSGVDNSEDAQVSIRSSVDKDSLRSESNKQLPTTKDSVDLRRNEIPEEPVQLPESSFGATEKKVSTSSSASSNASESNSVESGTVLINLFQSTFCSFACFYF